MASSSSRASILRAASNFLVSLSRSSLITLEGLGFLEDVFVLGVLKLFFMGSSSPSGLIRMDQKVDNLLHRGFTRRLRSASTVSGDLELLLRSFEWLRIALYWSSIDCVDVVCFSNGALKPS